ncbi:hypothetical protein ACMFMG_011534 [Clarireedia jacksonii]
MQLIEPEFTGEMSPPRSIPCLRAYLDWVKAWQLSGNVETLKTDMVLEDVAGKIIRGVYDAQLLAEVVTKFQREAKFRGIGIGSKIPPSCDDTDLLSVKFDPRVECNCDGLDPTEDNIPICEARNFAGSKCKAIEAVWQKVDTVIEKSGEWNGHGIFTEQTLRKAAEELTLINTNIQSPAKTCYSKTVDIIKAPDRRHNEQVDSAKDVYSRAFPTFEGLKLAADAKYFIAIACGVTKCDDGLARAVSDAANDVLIGDYCEAADTRKLKILQETGAAAFAFLRLCQMAGAIEDWHLDILAAGSIHFRVLSYYRDHARLKLPNILYGSSMTSLDAHRYIDLGISSPIVIASLASDQKIDGHEYRELTKASVLLNDLIDFRSDATQAVTDMVSLGTLTTLVTLGFCNWLLMASHHKVYEIVTSVEQVRGVGLCSYQGMEEYSKLLEALEPLGTTQESPPNVRMTRAELELRYCKSRVLHETHLAWLADAARTLLHPHNLRRIIDVAHFRWIGSIGDVDYCP